MLCRFEIDEIRTWSLVVVGWSGVYFSLCKLLKTFVLLDMDSNGHHFSTRLQENIFCVKNRL